jgi:hypothetical protein
MAVRTATHRIVCTDHTRETTSLAAAQRHRTDVEIAGHCQLLHTIEVFIDGTWVPLHIARARAIMAAPIGAAIDSPDGPLVKTSARWSKATGERADAAACTAADPETWLAALGPHEHATLTADGHGVRPGWCSCPDTRLKTWVRYELWTIQGRTGHGYICPTCRLLTQTG